MARIMRAPGRIIINPTTAFATSAYPHGATEIGFARACALSSLGVPFPIQNEALGSPTDILEPDQNYRFACVLRGWDDDAVQLMMAGGYAAGATSQHAVYAEPSNVPGQSTITSPNDRSVILAYIPDDVLNVSGLLIYRGIPYWTEGSSIDFQRTNELTLSLTVDCMRDGSGSILKIGRMADLVLS